MSAAEVVGVDISPEMVKVARAGTTPADGQQCSFLVSDASKPFQAEGGPFDLVLGIWLLNYAPDAEGMTSMWRNIVNNLRPGEVFVGMMPPPASDMEAVRKNIEDHQGPKNGVTLEIVGEVPHGYKTRFITRRGDVKFEIENYHLVKEIYESSAWEGGMHGVFQWRPIQLPASEEDVKQLSAGLAAGFGENYFRSPHCGMCVVAR